MQQRPADGTGGPDEQCPALERVVAEVAGPRMQLLGTGARPGTVATMTRGAGPAMDRRAAADSVFTDLRVQPALELPDPLGQVRLGSGCTMPRSDCSARPP